MRHGNHRAFTRIARTGVLATTFLSGSSMAAVLCPMGDSKSATAIGDFLGPTDHESYYQNEFQSYFRLSDARGWDEVPLDLSDYNNERTRFALASYLIRTGVKGQTPSVIQVPHPFIPGVQIWDYDDQTIVLTDAFHRSDDEWGPLSSDRAIPVCSKVRPHDGLQWCGSKGSATYADAEIPLAGVYAGLMQGPLADLFDFRIWWGKDTLTGIADENEHNDGAQYQWRPTPLSSEPDWTIRYYCNRIASNTVSLASTIVHENWHATEAPTHIDNVLDPVASQACPAGHRRCEEYDWSESSFHSTKWDERGLRQFSAGAYQIEQRFLCDLVKDPSEWVPAVVIETAADEFRRSSEGGHFVKLEGGEAPFTCAAPLEVVRTSCPDPAGTQCNYDTDCATTEYCGADACCTKFVVK